MTGSAKAKGDRGELEVQKLLRDLMGMPGIRRELGAGRQDDVGDIHGLPGTVIQVARYEDVARAIRTKLPDLERQRLNAGARFAAMFVRRSRNPWIVVQSPEQFAETLRWALVGIASVPDDDRG